LSRGDHGPYPTSISNANGARSICGLTHPYLALNNRGESGAYPATISTENGAAVGVVWLICQPSRGLMNNRGDVGVLPATISVENGASVCVV
jgi:hypothetical protein